jgi:hypothetical protein
MGEKTRGCMQGMKCDESWYSRDEEEEEEKEGGGGGEEEEEEEEEENKADYRPGVHCCCYTVSLYSV